MNNFSPSELWSIVASITSVLLALLAIWLSVYFFVINRKTEKEVSNSLMKIETQADILSKITGRQLDRLTKFVTQPKSQSDPLEEMIKVITELPRNLTSSLHSLQQSPTPANNEQLLNELVTCYIGLYFYCAQANFWSQLSIPSKDEFDEANVVQATARRIVNLSATDFDYVAKMLSTVDNARLQNSPVAHLLTETKLSWKDLVLDTTGVFDLRGKN
ncbi:MAG: hypothetical protein NPIRA03_40190 [Nitrospirales bacterium]|nr:MAG: hypothetical protein NPIRA03_40190 [Nitrospirales bacterium]